MSDLEVRENFLARSVLVHEGIRNIKEVEWLVSGLLPRGCLILFAGQPKYGRKSLLTMELSRCVSTPGERFLGLETQHGEVVTVNLEDGLERVMRRFFHFGIRAESQASCYPIHSVTDSRFIEITLKYIQSFRPPLLVIDPLIEWVIESGIENENDSKEVAKMLKPLRLLAQLTKTTIIIVHHFRKSADEMRGASALQGSCDGWWNIFHRKNKPHLLRFILRDTHPGELPVEIEYTEGQVAVRAAGEIEAAGEGIPKDEDNEDAKPKRKKMSTSELKRLLLLELETHPEMTYTLRTLRDIFQCGMKRISDVISDLLDEGAILKIDKKWKINPEWVEQNSDNELPVGIADNKEEDTCG